MNFSLLLIGDSTKQTHTQYVCIQDTHLKPAEHFNMRGFNSFCSDVEQITRIGTQESTPKTLPDSGRWTGTFSGTDL